MGTSSISLLVELHTRNCPHHTNGLKVGFNSPPLHTAPYGDCWIHGYFRTSPLFTHKNLSVSILFIYFLLFNLTLVLTVMMVLLDCSVRSQDCFLCFSSQFTLNHCLLYSLATSSILLIPTSFLLSLLLRLFGPSQL